MLNAMTTDTGHQVEISRTQSALDDEPDDPLIRRWITETLDALALDATEVSVHIVSSEEIAALNSEYRNRSEPTNVLSFDSGIDAVEGKQFLGDIVICSQVIQAESQTFNKSMSDRYAHILIHGLLHLLGYDHLADEERASMEALEVRLLGLLGITDPYEMNVS
jgi:probable rRNA maturation factor